MDWEINVSLNFYSSLFNIIYFSEYLKWSSVCCAQQWWLLVAIWWLLVLMATLANGPNVGNLLVVTWWLMALMASIRKFRDWQSRQVRDRYMSGSKLFVKMVEISKFCCLDAFCKSEHTYSSAVLQMSFFSRLHISFVWFNFGIIIFVYRYRPAGAKIIFILVF